MKLKTKISAVIVSMALIAGVGAALSAAAQNSLEVKAADSTTTVLMKAFNGGSSTTYVTTAVSDTTHYDVSVTANNYIPSGTSGGQIRGNNSTMSSNFYMFNTTTKSGYYLKSITLSGTGATFISDAARNGCQFGSSAFLAPSAFAGAVPSTLGSTSMTWTVADAATSNYGYFQINCIKTSGSMVNGTVVITWGQASTSVVAQLNASPSSKSYSIGDVIAVADYTITATLDGTPDSAYANYRAEVGSLSESTFTKRADVVFGTTIVASGDNCLRFYAQDPTVASGSTYATADVALNVDYATLTSLAVSPTTAQLLVGGTQQASVTPTPSNANPSVSWSSSSDAIASVSSSGLITAEALGNATITATSTVNSSISASVAVSVIEVSGYSLITSLSQLTEGLKVVIGGTNSGTSYAMSATQETNNRAAIVSTLTSGVLTPGEGSAEFTLGVTTEGEATVYTFHDASGYLYAASSSKNYLRSEASVSDDSKWAVTLTEGVFSLVAQGTYTRNIMRFNTGATLFACYDNAYSSPVALYGLLGSSQAEQDAAAYASSFISATETCSTSASGAWAAQKTAFQALSSEAQAVLVNATYNAASYASNNSVQKCAQRYDLAVSRQSLENFMGRAAISSVQFVNFNNTSTAGSLIAIVVISIISLSALSFVVLKRKNR